MAEKTYAESWVDYILREIKPDTKLVIEASNECLHLDLETGEMVSDHYSELRYVILNHGEQ